MQPGGLVIRDMQRRLQLRPPVLTAAAAGVGLLVTLLVLDSPYLLFGYHSPSLHLVLDSVDSCVASLLAYLLFGRYTRRRRLQDLLLSCGLACLAVAGLGLGLFLRSFGDGDGTLDVWLPLALRVLGAVLFLLAALAGDQSVPAQLPRWVRLVPVAVGLGVVVLVLGRGWLPVALHASAPGSEQQLITGHPLLLSLQALTAACFFTAAVIFTAQAVRRQDELLIWLGPACALAGFARVNYVLFPSLYSDWLYTGDILRTASYLLFLVGAAREIGHYWESQAKNAVVEDRRRLARELHDGVVQELGFIKAEAQRLPALEGTRHIIGACDVALDEARSAIDALGRRSDEPLGYVLHRAARQVADRYGGRVLVQLDDSVSVTDVQRHALVRITREAVSNALRHGGAREVEVLLEPVEQGGRLVVRDDGRGFDAGRAASGSGYGMTSMRERAEALPGSFTLVSGPDQGTTVEVRW